jgi:hypothetical protein
MTDNKTIPDLRVEEAEVLAIINKLKRDEINNFLEVNEYYHTKLFQIRTKLLEKYFEHLPSIPDHNGQLFPKQEYEIYESHRNYLLRYLEMLNKHPLFYTVGKTTETRKVSLEIMNINEKIKNINNYLNILSSKF